MKKLNLRSLSLPPDAMRIDAKEVRKLLNNPHLRRPSKYKAHPSYEDGYHFASKKEKKRYRELKLAMRAGEIKDLKLQPRYPLVVNGVKICEYRGDFSYIRVSDGAEVCEDIKGRRLPIFVIKAKLFAVLYGREIVEL